MPIKQSLKRIARKVLPTSLLGRLRLLRARRQYREHSREKIFSEVYVNRVWGESEEDLYSGPGSIPENVEKYAEFVSHFIEKHKIGSIVDFGCGDFQVGRRIRLAGATYLGCDIVPFVVERNKKQFQSERISFRHFDLLGDQSYPEGELCLIRQVLQHFSNADISAVLHRLKKYRYVLITDAQTPNDTSKKNYDIDTSHLSRTIFGSGLRLELPPFCADVEPVLEYGSKTASTPKLDGYPESIFRTVLLRFRS